MASPKISAFGYASGECPKGYACQGCGAKGVKLWRRYQTCLDGQDLYCAACALASQKEAGPVDGDGYRVGKYGETDQIGWLVPAVPTEDGKTFWGYTSVPEPGVVWWRRLPTGASDASA